MNDRIIELAIQAMAESCAHFGEDIPTQAEHGELYSDEESKWFFKRFAELVRNEVLEQLAPVKEPVYAFRRKGLDDFCTCSKERFDELSNKPHLFETTTFYAAPKAQHPAGELLLMKKTSDSAMTLAALVVPTLKRRCMRLSNS